MNFSYIFLVKKCDSSCSKRYCAYDSFDLKVFKLCLHLKVSDYNQITLYSIQHRNTCSENSTYRHLIVWNFKSESLIVIGVECSLLNRCLLFSELLLTTVQSYLHKRICTQRIQKARH